MRRAVAKFTVDRTTTVLESRRYRDAVEQPAPTEPAEASEPGRAAADRGWLRRLLVVVVAVALLSGVFAYVGLGGFRRGFPAVSLPLVLVAAGGTWWALRGAVDAAVLWAVAAAVLAVTVGGVLVEVAPPSRGRLTAELDALRLPFYDVVGTRATGNSRCSPCPVVERTYRAPVPSIDGTTTEVAETLLDRRLISGVETYRVSNGSPHLTGEREDISVDVRVLRPAPDSPQREPLVRIRLRGRR